MENVSIQWNLWSSGFLHFDWWNSKKWKAEIKMLRPEIKLWEWRIKGESESTLLEPGDVDLVSVWRRRSCCQCEEKCGIKCRLKLNGERAGGEFSWRRFEEAQRFVRLYRSGSLSFFLSFFFFGVILTLGGFSVSDNRELVNSHTQAVPKRQQHSEYT